MDSSSNLLCYGKEEYAFTVLEIIQFQSWMKPVGIVGVSILFPLLAIITMSVLRHILGRSSNDRVILHLVLWFSILFDLFHFMMLYIIQWDFCFVHFHRQWTWYGHLLSMSLQLLALTLMAHQWFLLQATYKWKDSEQRVRRSDGCCANIVLYQLRAIYFSQGSATCAFIIYAAIIAKNPNARKALIRHDPFHDVLVVGTMLCSVSIILALMYFGHLLKRRVKDSLENELISKFVVRFHALMMLLVISNGLRLVNYIYLIHHPPDRDAIWIGVPPMTHYLIHTIIPVSVTTVPLLWLQRKVNYSKDILHSSSSRRILELQGYSDSDEFVDIEDDQESVYSILSTDSQNAVL